MAMPALADDGVDGKKAGELMHGFGLIGLLPESWAMPISAMSGVCQRT